MQEKLRIKRFVRESLGCACSEEVFDHIEFLSESEADLMRIVIGNRLLIFIWKVTDSDNILERLPLFIDSGLSEKDRRGLNRFRLVGGTDNPKKITPLAEKLFNDNVENAENAHLHIIDKQELIL